MALTINKPGMQAYSSTLLKHMEERERSANGRLDGNDTRQTRGADPSVRLNISGKALSLLDAGGRPAPGSAAAQEEMQALGRELEEMVNEAGGFRRLTETQWERVQQISDRVAELNGTPEDERPRIQELKRVYQLEAELEGIFGNDPDKVLSAEESERADAILKELDSIWSGQEEAQLTEDEEEQLASIEAELDRLFGKLDDWTLTPEDEKRVDDLFTSMDRIFDVAEQRLLDEAKEKDTESG